MLGSIGAGKSSVAELLAEEVADRGGRASLVDADHLAHAALERSDVLERIRSEFEGIGINSDGNIDRPSLAAHVFEHADALERLEGIVHPPVRAAIEHEISEFRKTKQSADVLILDVPLLLGTPLEAECDRLVFVEADEATRLARVTASRGWDHAELSRRERHQRPENEKRAAAHSIVKNGGSRAATRRSVRECLDELQADFGQGNDGHVDRPNVDRLGAGGARTPRAVDRSPAAERGDGEPAP